METPLVPEAVLLYITTPNTEMAEIIGRAVVEERLAACANILPGMQSLYHWEGAIETAQEAVLILKTVPALTDAATARVRELHSYTVPAILAIPAWPGNPAYFDWLRAETQPVDNQ
jgi:periplasmic divalent cation tolerance protein